MGGKWTKCTNIAPSLYQVGWFKMTLHSGKVCGYNRQIRVDWHIDEMPNAEIKAKTSLRSIKYLSFRLLEKKSRLFNIKTLLLWGSSQRNYFSLFTGSRFIVFWVLQEQEFFKYQHFCYCKMSNLSLALSSLPDFWLVTGFYHQAWWQ